MGLLEEDGCHVGSPASPAEPRIRWHKRQATRRPPAGNRRESSGDGGSQGCVLKDGGPVPCSRGSQFSMGTTPRAGAAEAGWRVRGAEGTRRPRLRRRGLPGGGQVGAFRQDDLEESTARDGQRPLRHVEQGVTCTGPGSRMCWPRPEEEGQGNGEASGKMGHVCGAAAECQGQGREGRRSFYRWENGEPRSTAARPRPQQHPLSSLP